ncbi:MAG: epoxyqueuosine reductase [Syntrophus sp. (in: bacteria)]
MKIQDLSQNIKKFCRDAGADLVGLAPVERWVTEGIVPVDFRPQAIWKPARTVIVMGMGMPLPIVETTPSVLHMELYKTVNIKLDALAYDTTRYLNSFGYAATFFSRDGYNSLKAFRKWPGAPFGHVMAAKYAGLGNIGLSHCLLTPEFGPRVRFVSVFTALALPPDPILGKDLCIKCEACVKCCPKDALRGRDDCLIGDYDKQACLEMAEELTKSRTYPCGICTKVCPIGQDRKLYKQPGIVKKYLREKEALTADPHDQAYSSWQHLRRYGAKESR